MIKKLKKAIIILLSVLIVSLITPSAELYASDSKSFSTSDEITDTDISKCFQKQVPELIEAVFSEPEEYSLGKASSEISVGSSFRFSSFDKDGSLYTNKQTLYFPQV